MKKKNLAARMISGLLSTVMVLSSAVAPVTAFASEIIPEEELKAYVKSLPELGQVKDQLDPEEIVVAKDYEVEFEADIGLKKDFTNMQVPGQVRVTFYEAKNADKADFSTGTPGTYNEFRNYMIGGKHVISKRSFDKWLDGEEAEHMNDEEEA